jgi:putative lipoic acid-binding regulatory protein
VDKYQGLKEKLSKQEFPCKYMFKFIISKDKVLELNPYFEDAKVSLKPSRKGTYISFTALAVMLSPEEIIKRYKSLSHIEGLISL